MDSIVNELDKLEARPNLRQTVDDIQSVIDQLQEARAAVQRNPKDAPIILTKATQPASKSFDNAYQKLKEINSGLNKYQKSIKEKFKDTRLPFSDDNEMKIQAPMINRAIAMHLLREGLFDVATTFISEANAKPPAPSPSATGPPRIEVDESSTAYPLTGIPNLTGAMDWENDFSPNAFKTAPLQEQFTEMYNILHEMRENRNLEPAIRWAHENSDVLDARGSNLEFDLCRLQYLSLFTSTNPDQGPLKAVEYAKQTFVHFPARYTAQIRQLLGALAFTSNIDVSPYGSLFAKASETNTTVAAAAAFTSEFCALLSLSSASPLLLAVSAGAIALPRLLKADEIHKKIRTSWSSSAELPVEVHLPPAYNFHSIFVCPISKEQATDDNPPMLLVCGHAIARDSLLTVSKGAKFKCPYCPVESHPNQAMRLYL